MPKSTDFQKPVTKAVECPFCGKTFDYSLYPEIVIPRDRKLKKKVLNKSLFFPRCPHCKEEIKLKAVCMYRDDSKREWFVLTDSKDKKVSEMLKTGNIKFDEVFSEDNIVDLVKGFYTRRVVFDVDSFREKILLSDCNYDDRIIELMKLSLSTILEEDIGQPVYRIFLEETSGNQLVFTAIMGSFAPFEYVNIKTIPSVYFDYKDKYLGKLGDPNMDEYILTDQQWAKKSDLLKDEDAGGIIPVD